MYTGTTQHSVYTFIVSFVRLNHYLILEVDCVKDGSLGAPHLVVGWSRWGGGTVFLRPILRREGEGRGVERGGGGGGGSGMNAPL